MKAAFLALAIAGCAARREWVDIPGTRLRIELVPVPGEPSIWIAARETSWEQFDAFYEHPEEEDVDGVTRPSSGKSYLGLSGLPSEFMEPKRPVTGVRWHSALMYCEWLSRKSGRVFRLPTGREWKAADVGGDEGWHAGNSGERTHESGERGPNALGVYDLRGNAWEYLLEPFALPAFGPAQIGGGWNSPVPGRRRALPEDEWIQADPNRPASVWWFRTDFAQGFRGSASTERRARPTAWKSAFSDPKSGRRGACWSGG
jgi:formylglycine-generating enzyme required for sulfatase activity